ncbi:Histone chaperone asf1b-B [Thelohanellus kitauei]|uniref:Histone chaperone asf1b-B n=1 Tax=Thelohanellus kitauei TaxID=669202 RepID=A0A0C2JJX8_THEKT|nr:Histone chaperone asf1b-B [Thelohanellus kitauei]
MAKIRISKVTVLKNKCDLNEGFSFEIVFEAFDDIQEDIEWKVIYVGMAENEDCDQVLDDILVGPITRGVHKFLFETKGPRWDLIPKSEIVGLTVVLITAHYRNQEFVRVGYYVNNEYKTEEMRNEPPEEPILTELIRDVIVDEPRITTFHIDWDAKIEQQNDSTKN